jgi:hypothetical protein
MLPKSPAKAADLPSLPAFVHRLFHRLAKSEINFRVTNLFLVATSPLAA